MLNLPSTRNRLVSHGMQAAMPVLSRIYMYIPLCTTVLPPKAWLAVKPSLDSFYAGGVPTRYNRGAPICRVETVPHQHRAGGMGKNRKLGWCYRLSKR